MPDTQKVLRSLESEYADHCVDLFRRADGTFGFEHFRRDPEDMGRWTRVASHGSRSFATYEAAWAAAARAIVWLQAADAPLR